MRLTAFSILVSCLFPDHETLTELRHHGRRIRVGNLSRVLLAEAARTRLAALAGLSVDMEWAGKRLRAEDVRLFVESFEQFVALMAQDRSLISVKPPGAPVE